MGGDTWTHASDEGQGYIPYHQMQKERYDALIKELKDGCPCRTVTEQGASCSLNKTRVCRVGMTTCPVLFSARICCMASHNHLF
jgi:hypothetical protein